MEHNYHITTWEENKDIINRDLFILHRIADMLGRKVITEQVFEDKYKAYVNGDIIYYRFKNKILCRQSLRLLNHEILHIFINDWLHIYDKNRLQDLKRDSEEVLKYKKHFIEVLVEYLNGIVLREDFGINMMHSIISYCRGYSGVLTKRDKEAVKQMAWGIYFSSLRFIYRTHIIKSSNKYYIDNLCNKLGRKLSKRERKIIQRIIKVEVCDKLSDGISLERTIMERFHVL